MKQQSKPYESIRQNKWKQNRKKQHQAYFQQKRKQICQFHQLQEKELFDFLYPKISEDNYEQHKHTLKCFSLNNDYNFKLLAFTGLVYDYLIQNPQDQDSWSILEQISQFQEIEIPQTEEFAAILIKNLPSPSHTTTILTIIYNLLSIHRYQEVFRNELLQQKYISAFMTLFQNQRSQQEKQHIIYLHVSSCCTIASSHPALEAHQSQLVFNHLSEFSSEDYCKQLIAEMFSRINTSFKPCFSIAKSLSCAFLMFSQTNYKSFEAQMMHFFTYLHRSDIVLPNSVFLSVSESLNSPNKEIIKQALRFIALILKKHENTVFCSDEVMKKVISTSHHFKEDSFKQEIIRILTTQLTFKIQNCSQQLVIEQPQLFYSEALVSLLKDALHSSSVSLIKSATFFIIYLIGHIKQTLNMFILQIYNGLDESGLLHEIEMMENGNEQVSNQCDLIVRLWESQQK